VNPGSLTGFQFYFLVSLIILHAVGRLQSIWLAASVMNDDDEFKLRQMLYQQL
jgi:hypothetical protein